MCLIIQRKPNFEIPFDKFKSAILNNPDGYGLAFQGDKGLEVIRSPEEPDPESLYRLVNEELIDKDLMLHLRYTTAGATNLRNAHPFPILEKKTDGIDLRMCHNGTLNRYKLKAAGDESDTRNFVRTYVRPLFKRLVKGMEPEELLSDPFVKQLLEDQLSAASVLTFFDSEGNSLLCNEEGNGGKKEEGWYYSNTYSFNPSHRVKKYSPPQVILGGNSSGASSTKTSSTPSIPKGYAKDSQTRRFTDKFNLNSIRDIHLFTDETLDAIINSGSDAENATLLIKELIESNYLLHKKAQYLTNERQRLITALDKAKKEGSES